MAINAQMIKELRQVTEAGVLDCKKALEATDGDFDKAAEYLREKGLDAAAKKATRETNDGLVQVLVDETARQGTIVEVNCETDFVARTDEFKEMAHCLAMQVAALSPQFISDEEIPEGAEVEPHEACLLLQPYIKDPTRTVRDVILETIAKVGENIRVRRFTRYELGS